MKFLSFLSTAALLSGVVSGAYIHHSTRNALAKRATTKKYNLKVKSNFDEINNLYISTNTNTVGIFNNGTQDSAITVTTASTTGENADSEDPVSLTPYPVGVVQHALGLTGTNGYLEFRDLTQPSGHSPSSANQTYSYDEFTLEDDGDGLGSRLTYKNIEPGWIAAPAGEKGWKIKNYDDTKSVVIQNYVTITIYLEEVEDSDEY